MNTYDYHSGMRHWFKILSPGIYMDELFLQQKKIRIDLTRFDYWLHSEVGNYEAKGMNMPNAVHKYYGREAMEFIKRLI